MEKFLEALPVSTPLIEAIGWTVLHSLWQGTLIALLVGSLAAFIKRGSALVRYWTALAGLLATLVWALITFMNYYNVPSQEPTEVVIVFETVPSPEPVASAGQYWDFGLPYFQDHLPLIVICWLLGMSVFALRFLGGLAYVQYLRRQQQPVIGSSTLSLLANLQQKMNLKTNVQIGTSPKISVPMVMGLVKPLILLPAGTILALTPMQLEAIMAHELAHIKRRDYLANLLQSTMEVLFYYHPAVWWLSGQVRREREHCCDDMAVAVCGDDLAYAKALLSLQAYAKGAPQFALAFSNQKDHLLLRVKRVLNHPINRNRIMEKFSIASLVLVCLLVVSMRDNLPVNESVSAETTVELVNLQESSVGVQADLPVDKMQSVHLDLDTIPKGKVNIEMIKDGERIQAKLENGKIQELKVNGKVQPASAYDAYMPLLEEMMVPPPPPPAPPAIPALPRAPRAPTAPPAPPAPPAIIKTVQTKVEVKRSEDEEGNMIVFVTTDKSEEPMRIKVTSGDMPKVIINDETLVDGEEMIFISGDQAFNLDGSMISEEQLAELERAGAESAHIHERVSLRQVEVAREMEIKVAEMEKRVAEMEKVREEQIGAAEMEAKLAAVQAAEIRAKAEQLRAERSVAQDQMLNEMLRDGLIESKDNFKMKLSNESLRIDGKKQPTSVFRKYLRMYEVQNGPQGKFNVTIQRSGN